MARWRSYWGQPIQKTSGRSWTIYRVVWSGRDRSSTFSRSAVPGTHGRWKASRSKKPRTFGHESAPANSLASLLLPALRGVMI